MVIAMNTKIPLEVAKQGICSKDMIYKLNRGARMVTPRLALKIHHKFPHLKLTDLFKPDPEFLEICRIICRELEASK